MLNFKKVTMDDKDLLQEYYGNCTYESSEFSTATKLFWNKVYDYEYAITQDGSLVCKIGHSFGDAFDVPVPKPGNGIEPALDEIDEYCSKNGIAPIFTEVMDSQLDLFCKRYNFFKLENFRDVQDYIYNFEDLRDFKGRHYSGQRNHINKFKTNHPDYKYRALLPNEDLESFWEKYDKEKNDTSEEYLQEKQFALDLIAHFSEIDSLATGVIEVEGEVAAFCIGEILPGRVIVHIEKALREYEGIYPLMVSEFLKHLPAGIQYVNREEDVSDPGLRTSKLQYRPCKLLSKYVLLVQSELLHVEAIPTITTERLVLDEIKPTDAEVFQQMCLDDERNKYWGYDYRDDLEEEYKNHLPEDYFLNVAKRDFESRMTMSLAVRKDSQMIGEVVLYEADYKGGIEIGCRILKEHGGCGYGREAMLAAANWALYDAGFRKIRAKCYKENVASFRMLSSFMKGTGEDEIFFYFEKVC